MEAIISKECKTSFSTVHFKLMITPVVVHAHMRQGPFDVSNSDDN